MKTITKELIPSETKILHTGDSIAAKNASWTFDGNVAQNFDKHVQKSVPFYLEGHDLIAKVSDFFLSDDSMCYELGCSTAKLTEQLAIRNKEKKITFYAVDCIQNMLEKGKERCKNFANVQFIKSDIVDLELEKSDLIISYYTIQFIKPKHRQLIFDKIYQSLNWGGAFLLFEKVRASDARFQDLMSLIYSDYKLDQGYTPNEIISKSRSLKGILEPFSTQGNLDLLQRAGFVDIVTLMKYVCFEGFLAIK